MADEDAMSDTSSSPEGSQSPPSVKPVTPLTEEETATLTEIRLALDLLRIRAASSIDSLFDGLGIELVDRREQGFGPQKLPGDLAERVGRFEASPRFEESAQKLALGWVQDVGMTSALKLPRREEAAEQHKWRHHRGDVITGVHDWREQLGWKETKHLYIDCVNDSRDNSVLHGLSPPPPLRSRSHHR